MRAKGGFYAVNDESGNPLIGLGYLNIFGVIPIKVARSWVYRK